MSVPARTRVVPRRVRARRGEGEKLRDQILEAAEQILIRTGSEEAVSIRAVSDAVGVTPPSIYLHFADKNELLFAICERHFDRLDDVLQQAGDLDDDPLESLKLRGAAYVRFGLDHPEQYRILFMRKPAETPAGFQDERLMKSAAFDHLVDAVQRCIDAGRMEGDARANSLVLWAVVHGITSLLIAKPAFPWPDVDALIDHVLTTQFWGLAKR